MSILACFVGWGSTRRVTKTPTRSGYGVGRGKRVRFTLLLLLTLALGGLQEIPTAWRFRLLYEYFHIYLALSLLPYPTGVDITLIPYLDRIVKQNVANLRRKSRPYDPL
jgi:hypothetical protein